MDFDLKSVFAIVATIISLAAFFPYFRDLLRRQTKPHIYTWLIWAITQSTAVAGIWHGGGKWGAMNLTISTVFVFGIFLFSFKYGTRDITKFDTAMLIAALAGVFVWWTLNDPLLAILVATAVDMIGYLPTLRKSFKDPWSETVTTWILFVLANMLSLFALSEFNALTLTYIVAISIANLIVAVLCIVRRRSIPRP